MYKLSTGGNSSQWHGPEQLWNTTFLFWSLSTFYEYILFARKGQWKDSYSTLFIQLSIFAIIQVAMESCSPQPLCLFLKHIAKFFRNFLWPRALNRLFFSRKTNSSSTGVLRIIWCCAIFWKKSIILAFYGKFSASFFILLIRVLSLTGFVDQELNNGMYNHMLFPGSLSNLKYIYPYISKTCISR